jgi:hypothetical protein
MNHSELVNLLDWLALIVAPICLLAFWVVIRVEMWVESDPDEKRKPE